MWFGATLGLIRWLLGSVDGEFSWLVRHGGVKLWFGGDGRDFDSVATTSCWFGLGGVWIGSRTDRMRLAIGYRMRYAE